jgi:ABC-type nickel/cobalt efflux system permease component RcnA
MVLAFLAFGQLATTANRAVARRTVALWVVAALLLGWGTYGVARAAEPFLPALAVSAEHQHETTGQEEGTATHEHQAGEATPESHEHQH